MFYLFIEVMNSGPPNVLSITAASLCANDPVTVAMHFKRRVEAFINIVLKNPKGKRSLGEANIRLLIIVDFVLLMQFCFVLG